MQIRLISAAFLVISARIELVVTTFNLPEAPEEEPLLGNRPNKSATKGAEDRSGFSCVSL